MNQHSTGWFQVVPSSGSRDTNDTVADEVTFKKGNLISSTADFDTDNHRSSRRINMDISHTHTYSGTCTGDHTHSIDITSEDASVSTTSKASGNTDSTGSDTSFSIIPSYVNFYYIIKY